MIKGIVRPITNIEYCGLTFFYDDANKLIGFPTWYDVNNLDYRVGHQFWIPEDKAKAIIKRVLEQVYAKDKENEE